jgi:pseudouridine-5'-phosphate glycosidase
MPTTVSMTVVCFARIGQRVFATVGEGGSGTVSP